MTELVDKGASESDFEVIDQLSPRHSSPEPPILGPSDVLQQFLAVLQHKWPSADRLVLN